MRKDCLLILCCCLLCGCRPDTAGQMTRSGGAADTGLSQTALPRSDTARDGAVIARPAPQTGQEGSAWLLVPGKSAGMTRLGEDAQEVYRRLGPPDADDAAMQKVVAVWYADHQPEGHATSIYAERDTKDTTSPAAIVEVIRVTAPAFQTRERLGPGSNLTAIEQVFPLTPPETFTNGDRRFQLYDSPAGIAFEIGPDGKCSAVVIHAPGRPAGKTYLQLRFPD